MGLLYWSRFHPQAVRFNVFPCAERTASRLAIAAGQYFGIAGNGSLEVIDVARDGCEELADTPEWQDGGGPGWRSRVSRSYLTRDAALDCVWSEYNPNHVVVVTGDGSALLFDLSSLAPAPIAAYRCHTKESVAVSWSCASRVHFATASWDASVCVWDPTSPSAPAARMSGSSAALHAVEWHPRSDRILACGGADGMLRCWDARDARRPGVCMRVCACDLLCVDWNRYRDTEVVVGASDGVLSVWDVRVHTHPVKALHAHALSVRRVRASPFSPDYALTASYDMSASWWSTQPVDPPAGACSASYSHHREFVLGADVDRAPRTDAHTGAALYRVATASWDQAVAVFDVRLSAGGYVHEPSQLPRVPPTPAHMCARWPHAAPLIATK